MASTADDDRHEGLTRVGCRFNMIAIVTVVVPAVGSVAGYALVRSRDFVGA